MKLYRGSELLSDSAAGQPVVGPRVTYQFTEADLADSASWFGTTPVKVTKFTATRDGTIVVPPPEFASDDPIPVQIQGFNGNDTIEYDLFPFGGGPSPYAPGVPTGFQATPTTASGIGIIGSAIPFFFENTYEDTTYYLKVTSLGATGESLPSEEIAVVVPPGDGPSWLHVSWNCVLGARGYRLYNGASSGGQDHYVEMVLSSSNQLFRQTMSPIHGEQANPNSVVLGLGSVGDPFVNSGTPPTAPDAAPWVGNQYYGYAGNSDPTYTDSGTTFDVRAGLSYVVTLSCWDGLFHKVDLSGLYAAMYPFGTIEGYDGDQPPVASPAAVEVIDGVPTFVPIGKSRGLHASGSAIAVNARDGLSLATAPSAYALQDGVAASRGSYARGPGVLAWRHGENAATIAGDGGPALHSFVLDQQLGLTWNVPLTGQRFAGSPPVRSAMTAWWRTDTDVWRIDAIATYSDTPKLDFPPFWLGPLFWSDQSSPTIHASAVTHVLGSSSDVITVTATPGAITLTTSGSTAPYPLSVTIEES